MNMLTAIIYNQFRGYFLVSRISAILNQVFFWVYRYKYQNLKVKLSFDMIFIPGFAVFDNYKIWNPHEMYAKQLQLFIRFSDSILTLKAPNKICSRRHSKIFIFFIFQRKQVLIFHVNSLPSGRFTWNIRTCFHLKIKIVICFSCDWRFKG